MAEAFDPERNAGTVDTPPEAEGSRAETARGPGSDENAWETSSDEGEDEDEGETDGGSFEGASHEGSSFEGSSHEGFGGSGPVLVEGYYSADAPPGDDLATRLGRLRVGKNPAASPDRPAAVPPRKPATPASASAASAVVRARRPSVGESTSATEVGAVGVVADDDGESRSVVYDVVDGDGKAGKGKDADAAGRATRRVDQPFKAEAPAPLAKARREGVGSSRKPGGGGRGGEGEAEGVGAVSPALRRVGAKIARARRGGGGGARAAAGDHRAREAEALGGDPRVRVLTKGEGGGGVGVRIALSNAQRDEYLKRVPLAHPSRDDGCEKRTKLVLSRGAQQNFPSA